ncbi:cysteine--tRNA ligase [Buchnera aphidicola]|uniref:cysteine--tRNA ligase n=1 Tax=Buchnera aphidicola TaxID=9 RepID=UPI003463BC05
MLSIFNTLTKKKEIFFSIFEKKVNIYVCGVTVYDYCHIGHARTFLVFDMIVRYLIHKKYHVNYVRNITDIDDKIIHRSKKNNENFQDLSNRMIDFMNQDFEKLGLLSPNFQPRVTENIGVITFFIKNLLDNHHAYFANNGDILFSVDSYKHYGELSKQILNKLKNNKDSLKERYKKFTNDFVLWKNVDKYDLPNWKTVWGFGRPGWHIECSAINHHFFHENLDIHGGGSDLLFPHHENERAQSSCFYNKKNYGNYWIHVGSLLFQNHKMSKSLKNTIFLKDLLSKYDAEVIRYFFLSTHYRKPIHYSEENLKKSIFSLKKLYLILKKLDISHNITAITPSIEDRKFCLDFYRAMNNDFNTPHAISILFKMLKKINLLLKEKNKISAICFSYRLRYLGNILGLLKKDPIIFLKNL